MTALKALIKKEYLFSLDRLFVNLLIIALAGLAFMIMSMYWEGMIASTFVPIFGLLLFLYVPVSLWESFKKEWSVTGSFWLNQNVPGACLIIAKLAVVLFHLVVNIIFIALVACLLYIIERSKITIVGADGILDIFAHYTGLFTVISFISCAIGAVLIVSYVLSKSLPKFGALIGTVIGFTIYAGLIWVTASSAYDQLFRWGKIEVGSSVIMHNGGGKQWIELGVQQQHIGEALFVVGFVCLSIWVSSWLMDNKAKL